MQKNILSLKGFTLVEVMISIFILTVALLGLAALTVTVINGNAFSKDVTNATTLCQDKMEELKGRAYTDTELAGGNHSDADNPLDSKGEPNNPDSIYTRTWAITNGTNMKTIEVKVSWNRQGKSHEVNLNTIIAE